MEKETEENWPDDLTFVVYLNDMAINIRSYEKREEAGFWSSGMIIDSGIITFWTDKTTYELIKETEWKGLIVLKIDGVEYRSSEQWFCALPNEGDGDYGVQMSYKIGDTYKR